MKKFETKYGLPEKVVFCKKCIMSNQKPHSVNETTHKKDSKKDYEAFEDSIELNLHNHGNRYIKIIAYNTFYIMSN